MTQTAIKERPILFDSRSVPGILAGEITQTRRVIKPQPLPEHDQAERIDGILWQFANARCTRLRKEQQLVENLCPYGQIGGRLWVREMFSQFKDDVFYRADGTNNARIEEATGWKPSIHMPRWASRILLEVVDVRVERVQEISEADAIAEGAEPDPKQWDACFTDAFIRLWESINKSRGFGWNVNPWVWVVEFKMIESET